MKRHTHPILLAFGVGLAALAPQLGAAQEDKSPWVVRERGPDHRVWEQVVREPHPWGGSIARINRFTELATGMHVWDGASGWREAAAELVLAPGEARSERTRHRLAVQGNLNCRGSVVITTPRGQVLRASLLGLSYWDAASGKSVLLAEVKDSPGALLPSKEGVVFADSFTDFAVETVYVNRVGAVEQLVVLREAPPPPEEWGLDPASTLLQVITEFVDRPAPRVKRRLTAQGPDDEVNFAGMRLGRGAAFALGSERHRVTTTKLWLELDGRTCLVEQVPWQQVRAALAELPRPGGGSASLPSARASRVASATPCLPAPRPAARPGSELRMASVPLNGPGYVLDYILLTTQDFLTLRGDEQYYVTDTVTVASNLTVHGNAVVKFTNSPTAGLIADAVTWKTGPYRMAVFTAKDDNSVGDPYVPLPGSTGNPSANYYAGVALDLSGAANPTVSHARFSYLSNALAGTGLTVEHVQFAHCYRGLAPGVSHPTFRNVLAYRVNTFIATEDYAGDVVKAEHLTAHYVTNLVQATTSSVSYTNCLFVCVTNWEGMSRSTNACVVLDSDAGVFQSVGGGGHYLAPDSPYRNAGTEAIHPGLREALRSLTTYAPVVYSNVTVSVPVTFRPQAQRDTDAPDLGYHYAPLDHVFGGVTANADLTFAPGTAAGWFRTSSGWYHAGHGIRLGDTRRAEFEGRAEAPCYWVRYNTVQEGVNGVWAGRYGPGGLTSWAATLGLAAEVRARHLRCSVLGGEGGSGNHFRDDWGYLVVRTADSQFWGGALGAYVTSYYHTNGLFVDAALWLEGGQADTTYQVRNCTFIGGQLSVNRWANPTPVSVRDCVFDGTRFPVTDSYAGNTALSDYDYNAFVLGAPHTTNTGPNDLFIAGGFDWRAGPLGGYYLPWGSSLVDTGSLSDAALAGLYHYTTTTNLAGGAQQKELHSRVDRGFHYVALGADGRPLDSDGDGTPDYLEDANGNGLADSGETDWTLYNSPNGLTAGNGLQVFTPLK
ncbi:MAG TPA: hypothetical protein P5038_11095 [Candidatus Paceibacterota bacterium]|nr:hypothetical protein [Candidatus Paceibacterota bacterium]HRT57163.1 hypothetical protein [Candidatus Paceibacterota bacterium]